MPKVKETWRDIPGYVGLYVVSDLGRVARIAPPMRKRVKPTKGTTSKGKTSKGKYFKILRFGHTTEGRRQATLYKNGKPCKYQVHRLVCLAFNGPCPHGHVCRHLDGDHLNNTPGNLAWGTQTQNMEDKIAHGRQAYGEQSPTAKLTESDIPTIRAMLDQGASCGMIAREFGVTPPTIRAIKVGQTWGWLA